MDTQEKEKKLNLMRYWLFGGFAIIFLAVTVYFGLFMSSFGLRIFTQPSYWIALILTAVLFVVTYFIYKWFLGRK